MIKKIFYEFLWRVESSFFKVYIFIFKSTYINFISTRFRGIKNIQVGKNCEIGEHVVVDTTGGGKIHIDDSAVIFPFVIIKSHKGNIYIGKRTNIHSFCVLYGYNGIRIGSDCGIATSTIIVGGNHEFKDPEKSIFEQGISGSEIKIGNSVWIGNGAKILSGSNIGEGAVIGSGSVVTKDVPSRAVAYGVPAEVRYFRGEKK